MIDVVYTFKPNPGKRNDGVELLKKLIALNKKVSPGMGCRVLTPTTGYYNKVYMVLTYESHQQREEHDAKIRATPEWDAILKEVREKDLWVSGDRETHIHKVEALL